MVVKSRIQPNYLPICDVIKQNESEIANTVLKIQPNKADSFFLFLIVSILQLFVSLEPVDLFHIRRTTSVPLGKGTKFALHHGKMSSTKRHAIQILHISMFQFTFKCGYNDFIPKYTDINSLHETQINLLHNNTCCST